MYALLAVLLVFIKVPRHMGLHRYRVSKYMLAACFGVMSFNLYAWLFVFNDNWRQSSDIVAGVDLVLFYLAAIFYSFAFCNLLDKHYLTRRKVVFVFSKWIVSTTCVLTALFGGVPPLARDILLTMSLLILLWFVSRFLWLFIRRFRKMSRALASYWSEDQRKLVNWIYRCILLVAILFVLGLVSIRQGVVYNLLYQVYVVGTNLYIAIRFINFRDRYADIKRTDEVIENMEQTEVQKVGIASNEVDAVSVVQQLEKKVEGWVAGKKFVGGQFTIDDVAKAVGTNKTYLSTYINTRYGATFSAWITWLRLEEAKRLMKQEPGMKVVDVALAVGFSSASYFSRAFSKQEGMTPAVWRQQ